MLMQLFEKALLFWYMAVLTPTLCRASMCAGICQIMKDWMEWGYAQYLLLIKFPFAICSSFFSDSFRVVRRKIAERMATMTASEVRQDLAEEVAKVSVWISFYIVLLHLFLKKDFCRQSAGHIKKASLYPPSFYLYPPSFFLYLPPFYLCPLFFNACRVAGCGGYI